MRLRSVTSSSKETSLIHVTGMCLLVCRLERVDWMAQAEQLKQQTLTTLSERDQQLRQLTAMLEEARAPTAKLQQEQYQREVHVCRYAGDVTLKSHVGVNQQL